MAKKKKKDLRGQINFYKAMTALGAIVAGVLIYAFLGSAPALSKREFHVATDPFQKCLGCHTGQDSNIPIMPHRVSDNCTFCHKPDEGDA